MNRLALVPCLVVASYVAVASYIASPIVYDLGRSRVALKIPTSVANREEIHEDSSSRTKQTSSVHPSNEVPSEPLAITAAAVLPETPMIWVIVLLPARVHTGPSVDTPITDFYPIGTPLRATGYQRDWFEIIEPSTSKTGWIYRKYLGAISNSEQSKIASQETQGETPTAEASVPAKRYAKAIPVKRYANTIRSSKQSTRVKSVTPKPIRGRTELASLLQRAFSGY